MAKELIFRTDKEGEDYELKVYATNQDTVRLFIDSDTEQYGSACVDFNIDTAKELVKEIQKQIKRVENGD